MKKHLKMLLLAGIFISPLSLFSQQGGEDFDEKNVEIAVTENLAAHRDTYTSINSRFLLEIINENATISSEEMARKLMTVPNVKRASYNEAAKGYVVFCPKTSKNEIVPSLKNILNESGFAIVEITETLYLQK